jgi:hypothetical protein
VDEYLDHGEHLPRGRLELGDGLQRRFQVTRPSRSRQPVAHPGETADPQVGGDALELVRLLPQPVGIVEGERLGDVLQMAWRLNAEPASTRPPAAAKASRVAARTRRVRSALTVRGAIVYPP